METDEKSGEGEEESREREKESTVEEGEKQKGSGGKRGRWMRKVENREEESIGD